MEPGRWYRSPRWGATTIVSGGTALARALTNSFSRSLRSSRTSLRLESSSPQRTSLQVPLAAVALARQSHSENLYLCHHCPCTPKKTSPTTKVTRTFATRSRGQEQLPGPAHQDHKRHDSSSPGSRRHRCSQLCKLSAQLQAHVWDMPRNLGVQKKFSVTCFGPRANRDLHICPFGNESEALCDALLSMYLCSTDPKPSPTTFRSWLALF